VRVVFDVIEGSAATWALAQAVVIALISAPVSPQ
jgi:hypothetical protein